MEQHERVVALLTGAGWRVLPVTHGTTLASVWPLAGGRTARSAPLARPVTGLAPRAGAATRAATLSATLSAVPAPTADRR